MSLSTFVLFSTVFTVDFLNPDFVLSTAMPRRVTTSQSRVSDAAFRKQVTATQEALKVFNAIAVLNAPGPARVAMEELISVTVRLFCSIPLKNIPITQNIFLGFIFQVYSRVPSCRFTQGTLPCRSRCYQQVRGRSSCNSVSRQLLYTRRPRGPY